MSTTKNSAVEVSLKPTPTNLKPSLINYGPFFGVGLLRTSGYSQEFRLSSVWTQIILNSCHFRPNDTNSLVLVSNRPELFLVGFYPNRPQNKLVIKKIK